MLKTTSQMMAKVRPPKMAALLKTWPGLIGCEVLTWSALMKTAMRFGSAMTAPNRMYLEKFPVRIVSDLLRTRPTRKPSLPTARLRVTDVSLTCSPPGDWAGLIPAPRISQLPVTVVSQPLPKSLRSGDHWQERADRVGAAAV